MDAMMGKANESSQNENLIQMKWQWKNHEHASWFFPEYMNGFDEHWYLIIWSCWNAGSWNVMIHACKDCWIVAKFNDSVDASDIHHKRARYFISLSHDWRPSAFLSIPKGGLVYHLVVLAHHRVHNNAGSCIRMESWNDCCDVELKKTCLCNRDLRTWLFSQPIKGELDSFCLWHYIISMNTYTENINFFRLGVKADVLCVLCTLWARLSVYHHSMVFLTEVTLAEEISSFYVHSTGK